MNIIFNYEVYRDFCGMLCNKKKFAEITKTDIIARNNSLVYALPDAISEYCKSENIAKEEIIDILTDTENMVDYRSNINIKDMMIDYLCNNKEPSNEEVIAFLGVY